MTEFKTVRLIFTGVAALTPAYTDGSTRPGPIWAVLPNSPRARWSIPTVTDDGLPVPQRQIDAHLVFAVFDHGHLVRGNDNRDADYDYPDEKDPRKAVCFFLREQLVLDPAPQEDEITWDNTAATGVPTKASTGAKWIPRWESFAAGGGAHFYPHVIEAPGEYVRIRIPGGHISSKFIYEPPPQAKYLYGKGAKKPEFFAHEIVVTVTYPLSTQFVELRSDPFEFPGSTPLNVRLAFADATELEIKFGNGTLVSLQSILSGSFAGHDHAGPIDYEFQLLHDVIECEPDSDDRLPVPYVTTREISRVPCVASMLNSEEVQSESVGSTVRQSAGRTPESRKSRRPASRPEAVRPRGDVGEDLRRGDRKRDRSASRSRP